MSTRGPLAAAQRATTGRAATGDVRTFREDLWWISPAITALVLAGFVAYGSWSAFHDVNYFADPYLSPFYSPCLAVACAHSTAAIVGDWFPFSPALLILPFPLTFRLTCYYYRKAYYRAFWLSPPACAVAEPHQKYTGETRFPLILQNVHRYALYFTIIFPIFLTWDALQSFRFEEGWGIGVGSLVLMTNAVLLWTYSLSCHSFRHLCGGGLNLFSNHRTRYRVWKFVTNLNERHMQIAWVSLFGVALTDVYVRLVATGAITDLRWMM